MVIQTHLPKQITSKKPLQQADKAHLSGLKNRGEKRMTIKVTKRKSR